MKKIIRIFQFVNSELCNEGIIDIFDMAEALIKLRKLYNLPVIDIYGKKKVIPATKKLGKELLDWFKPQELIV